MSLAIRTFFRLTRSTMTPAIGLKMMAGANENTATRARAVADPVCCQTQIVSAKRVMPDPAIETNWPSHTMEKPGNPDGRRFRALVMRDSSIHHAEVLGNGRNLSGTRAAVCPAG